MELQSLIWDILGPYPDLHSGFNDFLTQCESTDFDITETGKGKDGPCACQGDAEDGRSRLGG